MRARCLVIVILLSWVFVQPVAAHAPVMVPFMYVPALPMGVPDFCANSAQNVPAGEEFVLSGTLEIGCLGIHGKVKVANGLRLKVDQILVYADGELTQVDPIGDDIVITYSNKALDPDLDPEQWGRGLIAFGRVRLNGKVKTPGVRLAAEVPAGATTLQLASVPTGWLPGDTLGLFESRQSRTDSQSETVIIASIVGSSITLKAPTQFAHLGARRPDGALTFLPHVANRTRSIVMRSEDPAGVRAHGAAIHRADIDLRYVELRDMGRTRATTLNSTTFNADGTVKQRGTNQIGRYSFHVHHLMGPSTPQSNGKQFTLVGLSINGFLKWGLAVHNAHWGLVQDCTIYDGNGAGIVTEDGSETANQIVDNYIAKINNFGETNTGADFEDAEMKMGACIFMRGPTSELRGNVCADTREGIGYNTATDETGPLSAGLVVNVPKAQGLDTMEPANVTPTRLLERIRLANDRNEVYAVTRYAIGLWVSGVYIEPPITHFTAWHCGPGAQINWTHACVLGKYSDFDFQDLTLLNEGGQGLAVGQFNPAFSLLAQPPTQPSRLVRADIRGFQMGWARVGQLGQARWWEITDSTIQATTGVQLHNYGQGTLNHPEFTWRNVKFLPMPGQPLKAIETMFIADDLVPRVFTLKVFDHQGTAGDNGQLYFTQPTGGEPPAPCKDTRPEFVGFFCTTSTPLPPADTDHDGVPDTLDKCPETPAGSAVDSSGCQPPSPLQPPTVTVPTVTQCTFKLSASQPFSGYAAQFQVSKDQGATWSNVGTKDSTTPFERTTAKLAAGIVYQFRVVWTKTGAAALTTPLASGTCG